MLRRSIEFFQAQDYPADLRELLILDDSPDAADSAGTGWRIISSPCRYPSLPDKYAALVAEAAGSVFVVWDDDDGYAHWHISAHVEALKRSGYSKPSRVLSDYPGHIIEEDSAGRFHGSIAFTADLLRQVGGWPKTHRADFDQQFMAILARSCPPADPCKTHPPSYTFRWHTGVWHSQYHMRSPDDEGWYDRISLESVNPQPA